MDVREAKFLDLDRLERLFDAVYSEAHRLKAKRAVVALSLVGLAIHLAAVGVARQLPEGHDIGRALGTSFLAALYTPFSFVLFYEVLLLILSIPESTTRSIGKQYEILSLIVIRNVFKDVAELETLGEMAQQLDELFAVLLDMAGGLVMFALVAAFYHVNRLRPKRPPAGAEAVAAVARFIRQKKAISLLLSVLLFALAAASLASWCVDAWRVVALGGAPAVDIRTIFYRDLFTVMIFADAVILLLSLLLSSRYELVFRNGAFIASTILVRLSLTVRKPYDVELGIAAMAFGILVLLVYAYYLRQAAPPAEVAPRGDRSASRQLPDLVQKLP